MADTIYLAGGCFWGLQKYFDQFSGVLRTEVGYANGPDWAPAYEDVNTVNGQPRVVECAWTAPDGVVHVYRSRYLYTDVTKLLKDKKPAAFRQRAGLFLTPRNLPQRGLRCFPQR